MLVLMAGAATVSAQSTLKPPPPPTPKPAPAPIVTITPDFKFEIDAEAIKAQAESMKRFALDAKVAAQLDQLNELGSQMSEFDRQMAELDKQMFQLDGKFQRGPGPEVRIIRKGDTNEDQAYQAGTRALDSARWDEAVMQFQRVVMLGGPRSDGAAYWTAWAQNRQGNGAAALASLEKLRQSFPNSKWLTEGRALEVEIRQATGQPVRPESVPDDELKLIALNSLIKADEQRVIPSIDKILRGTGSPRLKERALFVLAQNGTPQARQAVIEIAKGGGNPDLQAKAVTYLGALGGPESKQALPEIYKATASVDVKRSILRAFMAAGDRARLLDVAKTETSTDLRSEAVQQLGAMGAQDELSQLYQSETSPDVKKRIVQAMFTGHNEAKLIQLVRTETDEDLKRSIVQNLGMMASPASAEALTATYAADKNEAVRRAVIDAFGQQRNSKALIELAKKETDPAMKRRIVERLSSLKSTEATDYFLELLSKP
jgi:HEAT repeat protein